MTHRTAVESKQHNIDVIGPELGGQYSALWQELAGLHSDWSEYVALYGTKPSRIDLLNQAAPAFFHMVQDRLWECTLLNLARLTDSSTSLGRKDKANLTIQNLPFLVSDVALRDKLRDLIGIAVALSSRAIGVTVTLLIAISTWRSISQRSR